MIIKSTLFSFYLNLRLRWHFLLFFLGGLILLVEKREVVWVLRLVLLVLTFFLDLLVNAGDDATEAVLGALLVFWSVLFVIAYALVADISTEDSVLLTTSGDLMTRVA